MDSKEEKLERINRDVNNTRSQSVKKSPPVFEMFVTLFSISTSIMLFLFPDMLANDATKTTHLYWLLLQVMPQFMWAFAFFIAGVTKAIGMLTDNNSTRVVGLSLSMIIYIVFSATHTMSFPNIGTVVFACISLFTILSIPNVKHTGIKS